MIYFDNAATGGFKPNAVTDAVQTTIKYLSANPGRSGHRLSLTGAEIVFNCRETLSQVFNAHPDRVIFTKNCTEALNVAIFGSLNVGGHVITTVFEHNSVLRPLTALKNKGLISLDIVAPEKNKPLSVSIQEKITPKTYLIVATAISNVTGYQLPLKEIGLVARKFNIKFLVDGAQAGGHIDLNMKDLNVNMLALAGHKGLYGIMGSGALILDDKTDVEPLIYGGTGSESFNLNQPSCYPEKLEAGTLNLPAIAGFDEGVRFVGKNLKNFGEHLLNSTSTLIDGLTNLKNITCYSTPNRAGICAFKINHLPSSEVADILNQDYDIAVRGGLHCAPLMHKHLKTDKDGLVRTSLAVQNSTREINYFISAINSIANG